MASSIITAEYQTLNVEFTSVDPFNGACMWCGGDLIIGGYEIIITFFLDMSGRLSVEKSKEGEGVIICKNCRDQMKENEEQLG